MDAIDFFYNLYNEILQNNLMKDDFSKKKIYELSKQILSNINDINIKDQILSKLIILYPDDVDNYYKFALLFHDIYPLKSILWHQIGFKINPYHIENTTKLCKLLFNNGMTELVFELNKNNLFDNFTHNPLFLSVYSRCCFQKLRYENGIEYLLKLININAPKKAITYDEKHDKWQNYHDIGFIYCSIGETEKALQYTNKATELALKFNLELKDQLLSFSNSLCFADFMLYDNDKIFEQYLKINNYYKNSFNFKFNNIQKNNKKIRIGYLSSDFLYHAVTNFIIPILKNHDKNKFEIVLFANVDNIISLYKDLGINIHLIKSKSDIEVANLIFKENIDILFDLNGHTYPNRLGVFALNPAPIQITYLGYPNTTGLNSIHYRITDKIADNPGSSQKYSEKLLYLPKCFLLYKSFSQKTPTIPRKTPIIKNIDNPIILGLINKENKNTKYALDVWKQILKECPQTIILIKLESFDNNEERMKFYSTKLEISSDRIIILNKLSNDEYNNIFTKIDILLDTFPYSGTTTSCNALYNSIPVVTLYNKNYHSHNVTSSLLINSELNDLVAYSNDEYISIVKKLVYNPELIDKYKKNIHQQFVKSMETTLFMNDYEELLTNVYEKYYLKKNISSKFLITPSIQNNDTNSHISNNNENNDVIEINIGSLEYQKEDQTDLLFISVFDYGSIELALNHLQSLKNNNIKNYMAFVADEKTYNKVKSYNFNVTQIKELNSISNKGCFNKQKIFGNEDFTEMSFLRYKIINEQLKKYKAIWYLDVDTVVLYDLNKYYENYNTKRSNDKTLPRHDMIFQNDIHEITKCTGCALYFSNEKTIKATEHIYNEMNTKIPDQHYMNFFLEKVAPNVFIVDMFDINEFPNGLLFFDEIDLIYLDEKFKKIKYEYTKENNKKPLFIHANWIVSIEKKINALKKKKLWFI
jgi:predicted O-linked N-acetylglucosamine transferase (SPINDLY family)